MTLSIIDMRLKVFPQYLEYRINRNTKGLLYKSDFWTYYKKLGITIYNNNPEHIMSFDEWLVYNYSNLIL